MADDAYWESRRGKLNSQNEYQTREVTFNLDSTVNRGEEMQCGIDEAGRGPVIGPMVISIVCGSRDELAKLGVRDSKQLSRSRREELSELITREAVYWSQREISAVELNAKMETKTLNEIEEEVVKDLLSNAKYTTYVDCFDIDESRGTRNLSVDAGVEVHCIHDADVTIPSVSAASILSKVTRDRRIEEIEKEYGSIGSGYPSDPRTVEFLKNAVAGNMNIDKIVRVKWKTYTKLKGESKQGNLMDFK